ncbi:MAG: FAD-binding oxidoreductase [Roseitalea sp.]|jgi:FAD/FMN-containing dehydrogenase|nr:FAD-binding oxidoreductase [Roseitalea sp.]MBO6741457.1 FAD-binding oxidoreductase [Roseitalea sp.]
MTGHLPIHALSDAVGGSGRIATDEARRALAAQDISGQGPERPGVIARPATIGDLQSVVRVAADHQMPIVVRGGGLSYTGGYWALRPDTLMIDMRDLNAVEPVTAASSVVTVEAGATWAQVYEALKPHGLRLPVFGPLSGSRATVGGGVAQNVAFYGSATHGLAGDHVLAMDVVAGNGDLITVNGPEIAAYVGDAGILGIKARIDMRVIAFPSQQHYVSLAFDDERGLLAVQRAIAKGALRGTIAEAYGFDRVTHHNLAATGFSVLEAAGIAGDVARGAGSLVSAARSLTKMAVAPRAQLTRIAWSLHCVLEGDDPALSDAAAQLDELCRSNGGRPIPDTIPRVARAKPFRPVRAMLGPDGERWLPMHALFPPDGVDEALTIVAAARTQHRQAMQACDLRMSCMTAVIGDRIIVEPQFFWPDSLTEFLRANVLPQQLAAHGEAQSNPRGRELAHTLRRDLTQKFGAAGGRFIQLGKFYKTPLSESAQSSRQAIKPANDPDGLFNPGALEFN